MYIYTIIAIIVGDGAPVGQFKTTQPRVIRVFVEFVGVRPVGASGRCSVPRSSIRGRRIKK